LSGEIEIFIDGACRGNPGEAGIGVVINKDGKTVKEFIEESVYFLSHCLPLNVRCFKSSHHTIPWLFKLINLTY